MFDNNTIGVIGVANSGSLEGAGIRRPARAAAARVDVDITNNQIRQYNNEGIVMQAGAGHRDRRHDRGRGAPATPCRIRAPIPSAASSRASCCNNGVAPGDSFVTYLTLGGDGAQENIFTGSGRNGGVDMRIRARQNTDVHITANDAGGNVPAAPNATYHYTGGPTDAAAVATFVAQHNTGTQSHAAFNTGEFRGDSPPLAGVAHGLRMPSPAVVGDDNILSQAELDLLVEAAIERWIDAGATRRAGRGDARRRVRRGRHGRHLCRTSTSGVINIDSDGAGYGWFVDATPGEDSEFDGSGTRLTADAGGAAEGKLDLLTVLMHELGHQIGLDDDYTPQRSR